MENSQDSYSQYLQETLPEAMESTGKYLNSINVLFFGTRTDSLLFPRKSGLTAGKYIRRNRRTYFTIFTRILPHCSQVAIKKKIDNLSLLTLENDVGKFH